MVIDGHRINAELGSQPSHRQSLEPVLVNDPEGLGERPLARDEFRPISGELASLQIARRKTACC